MHSRSGDKFTAHPEAAGIIRQASGFTAWESLFDRLQLTEESEGTLLVVGATGGVGSMILQIAETLLPGVTTIATSSTPGGDSWVRSLGADAVVDYGQDMAAQLKKAAPAGVDWIQPVPM